MGRKALIAVDWGTSSLRAYLVAEDGQVLDQRASADGILAVPRGEFENVLAGLVGDWRHVDGLPISMSGMIGSRQGWVEAGYVDCPAGVEDIAKAVVRIETQQLGSILLFPGVKTRDVRGLPDVMRGEETQVLGALASAHRRKGLFVLPGTHSKWVAVSGGEITGFHTFMTGEVYGALMNHTILGRLTDKGSERLAPHSFAWGVKSGAEDGDPGSLLSRIFSARTQVLLGDLPASDVPDYLSGLLIGAELATAAVGPGGFTIIAGDVLQQRYSEAARVLGLEHQVASDASVAHGHLAIAAAVAGAKGGLAA